MPTASDQEASADLCLTLSDFTVTAEFWGFYNSDPLVEGERVEREPGYQAIIRAKYEETGTKKLLTGKGEYYEPNDVSIILARNRTETERSHSNGKALYIYIMESVFVPLMEEIQRSEIETAILNIGAEPFDTPHNRRRLFFGKLKITHKTFSKKENIEGNSRLGLRAMLKIFLLVVPVGLIWLLYFSAKRIAALITTSATDQAALAILAVIVVAVGLVEIVWQYDKESMRADRQRYPWLF